MINAINIVVLSLMLTASLFLNLYHETFPATMSACELKVFHLNTNTLVVAAARPALQAFWESELAPSCIKQEQQDMLDTFVENTKKTGLFLNAVVENSMLPYATPFITKWYRTTVQAVVASCWDPVHFKESLVTFASTVEACIPADVKKAWNNAFTNPVVEAAPHAAVVAGFYEWIVAYVRDVDYDEVLRLVNKIVEHAKSNAASSVDAVAHWIAARLSSGFLVCQFCRHRGTQDGSICSSPHRPGL